MDTNAVIALMTGLLMLIVAGSVFAITGVRNMPLPNTTGVSAMSTFFSTSQTVGGWIPTVAIAGGPIADLYYRKFKYSIISLISVSAMLLGLVFQSILNGTGGFVPALVVGTSASMMYLIQDAWMQKLSVESSVVTTVAGVAGIALTIFGANNGSTTMMTNVALKYGSAVLLGAGVGELAWVTTYNVDRSRLPFAPN